MVDFSNLRSEDSILRKLKTLNRQGRNRAIEFPMIEVGEFIIQVTARDKPTKWTYGPWLPKELEKLKKIPDLGSINVKIYEKRPKTEILAAVQMKTDKRFSKNSWASKFGDPIGVISPEELIEIIRYLQIINELVAFI